MFSLVKRAIDSVRFWWQGGNATGGDVVLGHGGDADVSLDNGLDATATATVAATATATAPATADTAAKGRKRKEQYGISEADQEAKRLALEASPQTVGRRVLRSAANERASPEKEGGMSLKEKKHLLREQITSMLLNAGWTVEYRPRSGKAYRDAVYVDAGGKTHWSVTLAYRRLAKKIEDGTADEKEVAAFTPIPQDQLCKLFRVTKDW